MNDASEWIHGNEDGSVTLCGHCHTKKCPVAQIDAAGRVVVSEFGEKVALDREQALGFASYIQGLELAGKLK